jgi:tetratricopeptide (TPR) repeat protein
MRAAVFTFLLVAVAHCPAFAGACTGAGTQLASVNAKLTLNDVLGAETVLAPIRASHPDCPGILLAEGRIAAAKGNAQAAADFYVQYTDLEPQDARGFAYFGRLFLDQRDYAKADALSAAAVDRNAGDPASLALRGQILAMKGQSSEGKKLLEKACQLDPNDPEAQYQLGKIYDKEKNSIVAVKHFRKATSLNPADARAWDYLGLNLEPLEQLDAAEQAYGKALAANQRGRYYDAFVDYNYGRFLAKRNQLSAAKQHLDRAVVLAPQIRAVWYERSKLNLRMKNYEQARTDAETAAATEDPEQIIIDLQIYSLLGQVYARLGKTDLAKKYAELTRDTPPPVHKEN